jgi:hypothetical protein
MTEQEINRAIQYVTASTSYERAIIAVIVKTGLTELTALATTSRRAMERDDVLEYVCRWTIAKTGHPEPQVREILGCAGRWLNELSAELNKQAGAVEGDRGVN